MENLLDCYNNIIKAVLSNNDIQISQIQMLSNIPNIYPTLDYPKEVRIIDLFEKQVKKTPNKTALVFGDKKYTYKELQDKVNKLAQSSAAFTICIALEIMRLLVCLWIEVIALLFLSLLY